MAWKGSKKWPPSQRLDVNPCGQDWRVAFSAGAGTFYARQRLKSRGARWDETHRVWHIAEAEADWAWAQIELAERTRVELPVDGPDPDPSTRAPVRRPQVARVPCFECGKSYPWPEFAKRPGADVDHYYCGCRELPAAPPRMQSKR